MAEIVATYDYCDALGQRLYQVLRYEPKEFRQRRPDGAGGWSWNLDGTRRVLYRLPELIAAPKQDWVYVVEGEKDTDKLRSMGFTATTCSGGANNWLDDYNKHLAGRLVGIIPDNDIPGRRHAQRVAESLHATALEVRLIELPGVPEGGDVSDWLKNGGTATELVRLTDEAPIFVAAKSKFALTDAGNAERFAAVHGDKLRYCPEDGRWYFYDGRRWNGELGDEKAGQLAIVTARAIAKDADDLMGKAERDAILNWSMLSESAHRLSAMLSLAKNLHPIVCHSREFDANKMLFNCLNGTIDLCTGTLRKHNAHKLITKIAPVEFEPGAQCDLWDKFLGDTTAGDGEKQDFLQRAVGCSLTGDTTEEKLFLIHGPTASGKSTFLEAVKATLGDYARTADFETFLKRAQVGGARNDVARLAGTRFVVSIEVDEGKELAEGLIKLMTGGDTVSARFLYHESFEFVPQCTLWLAANHAPRASDRDDALWRRIIRVPFEHTVPEGDRDPTVKARLRDPKVAGAAILAWAVAGCLIWQRDGLQVPDSVLAATRQYREEQDPLRDFFEDECIFEAGAFVTVAELRRRYEEWAKDVGLRYALGPRQFNERLKDKGCVQKVKDIGNNVGTVKPARCWVGVTLQNSPIYGESQEPIECQECQEQIPF